MADLEKNKAECVRVCVCMCLVSDGVNIPRAQGAQ